MMTLRAVRDALLTVPENFLDRPFIIGGVNDTYDFLKQFGPAEKECRIGSPDDFRLLYEVGFPIALLQSGDITAPEIIPHDPPGSVVATFQATIPPLRIS